LKIYPAIFGLVYLREKRFKEAGRLLLYGCAFFFLPFFFMNGLESMKQFLFIILGMLNGNFEGRIEFFSGLLSLIGITGVTATILNFVFMLCLLTGIVVSRNRFRQIFFLASFMVLVPGEAYRYTLIYYLLVLFTFLTNQENGNMEYVNAVILGTIFGIPILFGTLTGFQLNTGTFGAYTRTSVDCFLYAIVWLFALLQFILEIRDLGLRVKTIIAARTQSFEVNRNQ